MPSGHNNNNASKPDNLGSLIHAEALSCVRGENTLFDNLSLQIKAGQCLHIVGANGCGKTSLLKILSGLTTSDAGRVFWRQELCSRSESFFAQTAYIGHKDGLKNELTAIENLRFSQLLDGHLDEDKLDACLAKLQILQCADLTAQVLSFGQRRRLAFAKLLLNFKHLWILDEPFTGIDVQGRALIEELCVAHLDSGGAIVMTHHQSLQGSQLSDYRTELHLDRTAAGTTMESSS